MSILRKIFAVVIAMIVTGIVVGAVQKLGQNIYPLPVGADPENPEDIKNYIENAPFITLFFVIISLSSICFFNCLYILSSNNCSR